MNQPNLSTSIDPVSKWFVLVIFQGHDLQDSMKVVGHNLVGIEDHVFSEVITVYNQVKERLCNHAG